MVLIGVEHVEHHGDLLGKAVIVQLHLVVTMEAVGGQLLLQVTDGGNDTVHLLISWDPTCRRLWTFLLKDWMNLLRQHLRQPLMTLHVVISWNLRRKWHVTHLKFTPKLSFYPTHSRSLANINRSHHIPCLSSDLMFISPTGSSSGMPELLKLLWFLIWFKVFSRARWLSSLSRSLEQRVIRLPNDQNAKERLPKCDQMLRYAICHFSMFRNVFWPTIL